MADKHAEELGAMLKRQAHAVDVRTDHTTRFATAGAEGRTDTVATFPNGTAFIEVKAGDDGWTTRHNDPTKGWTLKQRKYAEWAQNELGRDVYICLFVGTDRPDYDPMKYKPRKAFLIPFSTAKMIVDLVEIEGINSIPYSLNINSRKFLKEHNISCISAFKDWELTWVNSGWAVDFTHPFYGKYLHRIAKGEEIHYD